MNTMEVVKIIIGAMLGGGLTQIVNVLINRKKIKSDVECSTSEEWRSLYSEMKHELSEQKKENDNLRNELEALKTRIIELATDIANYKQYDHYIHELESYTEHLLHTLKTIASEDAYREAAKKKPRKNDPIVTK